MNNKIWDRIKTIQKSDKRGTTNSDRICKLVEEIGELAELHNKAIGYKPIGSFSTGFIIEGKKKEIVDTMIVLIDYAISIGISKNELEVAFNPKLDKWENYATNCTETLDGTIPKSKLPFNKTKAGKPKSKEYPKPDEEFGNTSNILFTNS